jgi:hypothetical protein
MSRKLRVQLSLVLNGDHEDIKDMSPEQIEAYVLAEFDGDSLRNEVSDFSIKVEEVQE